MWNRSRGAAKFGNIRTKSDGYSFSSQLEASVYRLLRDDPVIEVIKTQDRILLSEAEIEYRPDFKCIDNNSHEIFWVEAKGFETPEWRIKRRLWIYYGPGRLLIYKGSAKNLRLFETLEGKLNAGAVTRNNITKSARQRFGNKSETS